MVNYEYEIKKVLIKLGSPLWVKKWMVSPCYFLDGHTPRQYIEEGKGNVVLNTVNELYKFGDSVLLEEKFVPP